MFLTVALFQVGGQNLHRRCWVPLFREFFSPLPEGVFGQNLGVWKSIFWTLNLHFLDRKKSRLPRFQLAHFSNAVDKICWKPCWVPLFGALVNPLPEGVFGWNFGGLKVHILNFKSTIFRSKTIAFASLSTSALFQRSRCWVPLFGALVNPLTEGVFGRNLGVSKSIWWTSNLQFLGRNQSRLPHFQIVHFSYHVGQICWNLAEYPCLGNWLTHFPRDFLDETWGFRSPYDGL